MVSNPETWQVWVRYTGKAEARKLGEPADQVKAMKQVENLNKLATVAEAWCEEST